MEEREGEERDGDKEQELSWTRISTASWGKRADWLAWQIS